MAAICLQDLSRPFAAGQEIDIVERGQMLTAYICEVLIGVVVFRLSFNKI